VCSETLYTGRPIVPEVIEKRLGGYRFLPGLAFASQAVVAADDMAIERGCFPSALPLAEGFNAVRAAIEELGRPLQALCGFDLRLPAARRLDDFLSFNNEYLAQLRSWDLLEGESSPLARTNVAPLDGGIETPAVIGFSYTVQRATTASTFVISGAPEVPDDATGPDDVIRLGETDPGALTEKLEFVVENLKTRLSAMQLRWTDDAAIHLYTAHDACPLLDEILARERISPVFGITWHKAAPPVDLLELEIDLRRYQQERIIN
jgi:hypothetical protein